MSLSPSQLARVAFAAALAPAAALASTFTFSTTGLTSMAHGAAYTWGLSPTQNSTGTSLGLLEQSLKNGKEIGSATLTINGLYDWTKEPADVLYVNILTGLKPGLGSYVYNNSPAGIDTTFGRDVFDVVSKPSAPVAPITPTKPTMVKPTAPAKPTIKLPTAPAKPTIQLPTPPTPLPPNATTQQKNAYAAALATYNTNLAKYQAAQAKYQADLATYNTNLAAYNAAQAAYATALAAYNTNLATYNALQAKYTADLAQYNKDLATYKTALTQYNADLTVYNNYAKTQAALGFEGVSPTSVPDSIYDQAHSLLVADHPNGPGTWTDLDGPATKDNLNITFSSANIDLLESLLIHASSTTDVGLGFGPDCHFYDKNITLTIKTVPETGATLMLLGLGLAGLAGVRRFSKKHA